MTPTLEAPMAKKITGKHRYELQADQSWYLRATRIAKSLGLTVAAYIRMAVSEDMDRREKEKQRKD